MIATIPTYSSNVCELSVDEGHKKLITTMTMAVIANGRFLGGGFMAALKAHISDGLLDVVVPEEFRKSENVGRICENERRGQ